MVGITGYGAYIPRLRLTYEAIAKAYGGAAGPGEKAVANYDEDSITIATAAALDCLQGVDRSTVDGLYFASTTSPYKEKQASSVIALATDLRRDVVTTDFGASLRASTSALRAALDAVKAGSAANVLVTSADCRMGAPQSEFERNLGDGAVALMIGSSNVVATVEATYTVSDEFTDVWRAQNQSFVQSWEDRFIIQHGYATILREALQGLMGKAGLTPKDIAKVVFYGPDPRSHAALARALGFDAKTQVQDPLFGKVGNTGSAFATMLLVAALESAKAGDRVLVGSYGDGADAFLLKVTENVGNMQGRRGVKGHLARKAPMTSYDKYLRYRNLVGQELDRRSPGGVSMTVHWRDRGEDIAMHGQRCKWCGTYQYPFQRVCYSCFATDQFDEVRLSDKKGQVFTYTKDYFGGTLDPPTVKAVVELEGPCRMVLQMTDGSADEVDLDLPVEMTFRKIHDAGGTSNYYWKCTPVR